MKKRLVILLNIFLLFSLFASAPAECWFSAVPSKTQKTGRPLKVWRFTSGTENWIVPTTKQGKVEWDKSGKIKLTTTEKRGRSRGRLFSLYVPYRPLPGSLFVFSCLAQGTGDIRMAITAYSKNAQNKLVPNSIWSSSKRLTGKRQKLMFAPDLSRRTAVRLGLQIELVSKGSVTLDDISISQLNDTSLKISADPEFTALRPGEGYPDLQFKLSRKLNKVQFFPAADPASPTAVDMTPDANGVIKVSRKAIGKGKRFVLAANGNTAVSSVKEFPNAEYDKFDKLAKKVKLKKPLRILVLGDSLLDPNFHCNADSGAVKQLNFWLRKYNPGKVIVRNAAVRGDYIERVWNRMSFELKRRPRRVFQQEAYDKIFAFPADLVFILLGHNDTRTSSLHDYKIPFVPKKKQEEMYVKVLTEMRRLMPKSRVVLFSSTSSNYELILANHERARRRPRSQYVIFGKPQFMEEFNAILKRLAPQFNAIYHDIYTPIKKLPQKEKGALFDRGGVHLSDAGQDYLAYQFLKFVAEYPDK